MLTRYQSEKARRGLLDYDDLIDKALSLLRNVDAAWVHYKLDLGIDHLLIDEAQDTSHKQWEIVRQLVAEFTAGAGARDAHAHHLRGRRREAIDLFVPERRAEGIRGDAALFRDARTKGAALDFVFREFEHSFRSGDSVLGAVDEVFKAARSRRASPPTPTAFRRISPCRMRRRAWSKSGSRTKPDERSEIEGWDAPFDTVSETSPRVKLAQRIARTVRGLSTGTTGRHRAARRALRRRPDSGAPARPNCSRRSSARLKNESVEVAGADRLVLTEHIAVMDLMALADALLLPQDDLALATVLRSPLFGFSDDDLFAIAWDRGRASLRAALARKAAETEKYSPRPPRSSMQLAAGGAARDAVCLLCASPRRRRRRGGASWRGSGRGKRCARRIPQSRARL